jgi:hypothetical protein
MNKASNHRFSIREKVHTFTAQANAVDPDAIVGVWLFDEGEGEVIRDSSGNGNDGNVAQSKWVDGKFGDAVEFTGSGKPLNKVDDQSLFFGSGINDPGAAPGSAQKFKGALDEVAIFNTALSEDEVKELMEGLEGMSERPVEPKGKLAATWGKVKMNYR